ncbi:type II toxin-antitoxin system HicB family antitoxin [Ralstonia solanacearum]|nr:DNA repair protein [Ralstonia solanacearum FJAT-1458]QKL71512.1 type II toxin-antitoxin system HicB family antitoxin [Ralstonia solanacearum]QKL76721.1 type II toxin-antitoxin system HicB family antitoxin [Ralstonia solanacearum]QKL81925.1 type II toxin-antitoxin system HicB family antitoxin [Ralstonia solanacearum]QKL87136.1 type II toxin-antitoxin system HicB family antitoxin [Ralstonia solanacearum]
MNNVMIIGGEKAVISFDPELEMFRGEFIGLNGGADFYASDVAGLHREGELSLRTFMEECVRRGVEPRRSFSGKFVLRTSEKTHEAAAIAAAAHGVSLNQWVSDVIEQAAIPA